MADIAVRGSTPPSWARNKLTFHFGSGLFMTIPLPPATYPDSMVAGDGDLTFWRIGTSGNALPPNPMTVEFIQSELDRKLGDFRVEITAFLNGTRYSVRCAVAEQLYKALGSGHVLLVGDAAHVHGPAGAQGLNLGMCDAMALAKAISAHIKSQDNQTLLDHSTTRRTRAIQVIKLSSSSRSVLVRIRTSAFFRQWIVGPVLNRMGFLKSWIVWQYSGLGSRATAAK